ncbi:MAG: RdgB/HAM1 family non-canonical purine NTP pyrophosphatase [Bryobacteraceae bacterium]|nr:RdgB/HAM1 family non-canonical purine NTP pyrophosphatase [Bryobacteraceae bacterium]
MILYCATSNPGKLREFALASSDSFRIEPLPGLEAIAPPEETGTTFEENAISKALAYGSHTREWLFAEDSGLEVDALCGEPGVRSARYAGPDATDESNNRLLLGRMGNEADRRARFVCVIALVHEGRVIQTFRGTVEGEILRAPTGTQGFGYDPLFYYPPFASSFGEADPELKQAVSHRGCALRSLADYMQSV